MPILVASAQEDSDTTTIAPISINAYFGSQPLVGLTSSANTLSESDINAQQTNTLVSTLNSVPGIRFEERSPGSYRLALRGSMIRSPFGIRNTKIYIDEFPLTDAGGNSYLNLIDPQSISSIHILKGPDGSLFGANSSGIMRIQPKGFGSVDTHTALTLSGGSYGSFTEQLSLQRKVNDKYQFSFDQAFVRSDGYRENTALNKKTFQTAHQWRYNGQNELRVFLLYTDLGYQTPGALTAEQMAENPRMARPSSASQPGSKEQKAAIYNKTLFTGIAHQSNLSKHFIHHISVFGSVTDLENPFITNYEIRDEKNLGARTYLSYHNEEHPLYDWQMQVGSEVQKGWSKIDNYDNTGGIATNPQAKDDLDNLQASIFYRANLNIAKRWTIEGSVALNYARIDYATRYPVSTELGSGEINFGSIWMPRLAGPYMLTEKMALRASISKGYSTPTLAEVRSSNNIINTDLQAETGTNYEFGYRIETKDRRLIGDVSVYSYKMENGIVRQIDQSGVEYYKNAGQMKQRGLEANLHFQFLRPRSSGLLQGAVYHGSLSRNYYKFGHYTDGDLDFSGNDITAVPKWVGSNNLLFDLTHEIFLNINHRFSSKNPLNDANTVFAKGYQLIQTKAGINLPIPKNKVNIRLFVGVDNLLDESYSLGNDINAFGNRYYNPAPKRNYFLGAQISL